jgi:hypothetical protein
LRLVERAAVKDTVQLVTNRLLVGLAPAFALNFPHVPTPTCRESASPATTGDTVAYRYILGRAGMTCHVSRIVFVIDDEKGA